MDVDCGTLICHVEEIWSADPCVIYFGDDCQWPCITTGCKNETEVDSYCAIIKYCEKKPVPPNGNNTNVTVIIASIFGALLLICGIYFATRFFIRKCSEQYHPAPTQNDSGTSTQNDSGSGSIENYNFSLYDDSDDDTPIIRNPRNQN